jgi:hypothetical protein
VALVAALYWALDRLLIEVEQRRKDISYSSRTRLNTDNYHQKHLLRRAIADLYEHLPSDAKQRPECKRCVPPVRTTQSPLFTHIPSQEL